MSKIKFSLFFFSVLDFLTMSTISVLLSLTFFLTTISALPAPKVVYSAIIYNAQDAHSDCKVTWLKPTEEILEGDLFGIPPRKGYAIREKLFDMGTWEARGIIDKVQCGSMVLKAPFEAVTGPSVSWRFVIRPNKIHSIKPKSV